MLGVALLFEPGAYTLWIGIVFTIVVEGKMSIQFYTKSGDELVPDGEMIIRHKGDTGYIKAGRILDAKYIEQCKLV